MGVRSARVKGSTEHQQSDSMIDVISVGSVTKREWQEAQQRTFGTKARYFFPINERNDTDSACHTDFTLDQLEQIESFCSKTGGDSHISKLLRSDTLFKPNKHTGWMCAQKRPVDGLNLVLKKYMSGSIALPDYLAIIDDDTYLNLDQVEAILRKDYPPDKTNVLAGCNTVYLDYNPVFFDFPYGGFGSFLPRAALERLMRPIHCTSAKITKDPFVKAACERLQENPLGEQAIFENGMRVADLLYEFSARHPFTNARNWNENVGFCLHSDVALAYFFNYYHIAVPDNILDEFQSSMGKKSIQSLVEKHKYQAIRGGPERAKNGREGECLHKRDECRNQDSLICHYQKPDQMDQLWKQQQEKVTTTTTANHPMETMTSQLKHPTTDQYPRILMANFVFGEKAYNKGYFRPFVESLRYAGIDFAIVGSPAPPFELPPNVKHIEIGWEEFYANALERLFPGEDMKDIVASSDKYKVIDFKPLFAFLFPEEVKGYDWWGHLDCDMLIGDVPRFLTREFLEEYDIVAGKSFNNGYPTWGPFTIYRNTPQLNELFRLGDIRYIFTNQTAFAFDEWGFGKYADISMSSIVLKNYERLGLRFARTGQPRAWDGYNLMYHTRKYTECSVTTTGDRPKLLSDESNQVEGCEPHSTEERCNKEIMLCHYEYAKTDPAWDTLAKSVAAVDDEDWKSGFRMSDIRGLVI